MGACIGDVNMKDCELLIGVRRAEGRGQRTEEVPPGICGIAYRTDRIDRRPMFRRKAKERPRLFLTSSVSQVDRI